MSTPWSCILFDLDGTILDSAPGITESLAYMFTELGRPVPPQSELLRYVGPPILDSFRDLAGMNPRESQEALDIYRVRYLERGALQSTVYPGVAQLLRQVHGSPIPLSLATSKPELPATKMLNLAGLTGYFDAITGASEDEVRSRKSDVVAEALRRLEFLGADISAPVMVGDREHDVSGAAEHDVPTIFVTWGYGTPAESEGTIASVDTATQLHELLLGESRIAV
ncbi:HAD hydrolase-like protein [Parafrigoribacterium soli]|uniref:HAD hydrolase-like protein n=1 Tax=Parafrigoribacterium soli TaxID=3144663 RepID=UPI0032EAEF39